MQGAQMVVCSSYIGGEMLCVTAATSSFRPRATMKVQRWLKELCYFNLGVLRDLGTRGGSARASLTGDGAFPRRNPDTDSSPSSSRNSMQSGFCIIEGRDTVLDFAPMQLQEIRENVNIRRNKIFLLMEEVRRLRIQQRIKSQEQGIPVHAEEVEMPEYPSSIPFFPPLTTATLQQYYATCLGLVTGVIVFGGLLAPVLELKLGLGGTSYEDFIRNMHLPMQLSQVDPIVASFSGGAVGVISALVVVETNNVKQQEHKRCKYCHGTGYLACARCSGVGTLVVLEPQAVGVNSSPSANSLKSPRCTSCAGAGKVMCPTCFCTGMALASEHDPRIDPFD